MVLFEFSGTTNNFDSSPQGKVSPNTNYLTHNIYGNDNNDANNGHINIYIENTSIDTSTGNYIAVTIQNETLNTGIQIVREIGDKTMYNNFLNILSTNDTEFKTYYLDMSDTNLWGDNINKLRIKWSARTSEDNDTQHAKSGTILIKKIEILSDIPPAAPICFPKGTPVTTDQGIVSIEKLNTEKHTIRGKEIVAITQSRPLQKHIVCFEKDSLSKNVPSQQTLCSMEHKVFYKGEMMKARDIVDVCENVTFVPYNGETLFNVLLKKEDKMMINNLICETLHPKNIMAKISTMKNEQKKSKAIQELTKIIKENNVPEYQKLYASL